MAYFRRLKHRNTSRAKAFTAVRGVVGDTYYVYQITPYEL